MSLGFEQAGFDIVLSVDRDGYHTAAHKRNFPNGVAICGSVSDLTGDSVRKAAGILGEIDLVFGGPPCQGFSHMGLRDPGDTRNTLPDEFARLIGELKPKAFVMENVVGMNTGETRVVFDRLIATMTGLGYKIVSPVQTLNAMNFGVPQNRERLFVLGLRSDVKGALSYPDGPCPGQPPRPTVMQAIGDLPDVDQDDALLSVDETPYTQEPSSDLHYARVARGLMRDPSDFSHKREWTSANCTGCIRVRHSDSSKALYAATPPGSMVPGHKLPRLDPNGIAPTLRAGSESEHGSHTAPRPVHPRSPRCVTIREAARLHGFPDWFRFYPGKWHAYRQIGNAVCPPVARAVGRQVMLALGTSQRLPADTVTLGNEFILPKERMRQQARIPHLEELPQVIDHLFAARHNLKTGEIARVDITVRDIEEAVQLTGAKTPRTRAERLIAEIARSRNVRKLIATPLKNGFSILPVSDGDIVGRFVPVGTSGTIEERDSFEIRSQDLIEAQPLRVTAGLSLADQESLLTILQRPKVLCEIFGAEDVAFTLERDLFGTSHDRLIPFTFRRGKGTENGLLVLAEGGKLPPRSRLARIAEGRSPRVILLLGPLTTEHLVLIAVEPRDGVLAEMRRLMYRIVEAGSSKKPTRAAVGAKQTVP